MASVLDILGGPITQIGNAMRRDSNRIRAQRGTGAQPSIPGQTGLPANPIPSPNSSFNKLNQPQMVPISQGPGTGADQTWGDWWKEHLFGQKEGFFQIPTVTPQVANILQQVLGQAGEGLQNPYAGFEPLAQQAREQFETQTVPSLAERFTALGSGGGSQRSSAFQGALGSAASDLEKGLAALQAEYGLRNRESLLNQLKIGLYPQFENLHRPGTAGAAGEAWNTGKQASMQLLKILPYLI